MEKAEENYISAILAYFILGSAGVQGPMTSSAPQLAKSQGNLTSTITILKGLLGSAIPQLK